MNKTSIGRYKIIKLIASGGMADVYKAVMTGPHNFEKLVALKIMHGQLTYDDAFVKMFIDEAKISSKLVHPNIVQIMDFGEIEKKLYLTMEYVNGVDLSAFLKAIINGKNNPQIEFSIYIVTELLKAIDYICRLKDEDGNSLDIVHRDITPQNILLSYDGDVKLTDFGIAKARGSITTTTIGTLKGKLRYMSPEQARGEPIDYRSDLYSIALVFYELLTHKQAYPGDTDMTLLKQVQRSGINFRPSSLNASVPSGIEDIVMKALSPNIGNRFQDSISFKKALDPYSFNDASVKTSLSKFLKELFGEWNRKAIGTDKDVYFGLTDSTSASGNYGLIGLIKWPGLILAASGLIFFIITLFIMHGGTPDIKPVVMPQVKTTISAVSRKHSLAFTVPAKQTQLKHARLHSVRKAVLVINASPWAKVYIVNTFSKRFIGITPIKHLKVAPGSYVLLFENKIYGTKTVKIKIPQGKRKMIVLRYNQTKKEFIRIIK